MQIQRATFIILYNDKVRILVTKLTLLVIKVRKICIENERYRMFIN